MNHFKEQFIGHKRPVLFEKKDKHGQMQGYSDNYIQVNTPYEADLVNTIVDWEI